MSACIAKKHADLLEAFYRHMWYTSTTIERVFKDLVEYPYGTDLTLVSPDGRERTVQIENLQDVTMIQGDRQLRLHVNDNGYRFMCFLHMNDVRMGRDRVEVSMLRRHYEHLFGDPDSLASAAAAMATTAG